ncbi:hypothetical protein [Treponema sp.]|uniref:hypothetical protein n=1 Tax=Treponema sp. TaxID=166 RepID=UPI0025E49480|nr:hypothetical protein [Treponema sp.]MCR5218577.1 hypothetical protein [Treponema sp.]
MTEKKDLKTMNTVYSSRGLLSRATEIKNAAIIQNKDGIASINKDFHPDMDNIDPDFKRLVDSVLR